MLCVNESSGAAGSRAVDLPWAGPPPTGRLPLQLLCWVGWDFVCSSSCSIMLPSFIFHSELLSKCLLWTWFICFGNSKLIERANSFSHIQYQMIMYANFIVFIYNYYIGMYNNYTICVIQKTTNESFSREDLELRNVCICMCVCGGFSCHSVWEVLVCLILFLIFPHSAWDSP